MAKRRKKRGGRGGLLLLLLIILIAAGGFAGYRSFLGKGQLPADPAAGSVSFTVPAGASTSSIGRLLEEQGLIRSSKVFKIMSKKAGYDGKYQAGEYQLSAAMPLDEIMHTLLHGKADTKRFTIPEGYDIRRTAEALEAASICTADAFRKEVAEGSFDHWFLEGLPAGADRLEGYLFPETYEVYASASAHDVVERMLAQFEKVFTDEYRSRAAEIGMSVQDVIILASIIEREAVVQEDRPVIAGVFYNRLERGMLLQSCATVQYILGEQKARLTNADTQIESPYNTYLHEGLPPGPICSPGELSIRAALWPEETDYLYFLAKGDGSHVFSRTHEEHLANKAKYID